MDGPIDILTAAESAAADAAASAEGVPLDRLMRRAGEAVAACVEEMAGERRRVAVLCGPGNNGGDGYVAARVLAARGFAVEVFAGRAATHGGAAARARDDWMAFSGDGGLRPFQAFQPAADAIIVDALYGAGLNRPIGGEEAAAIARAKGAQATVVAVDLPSGLSADSGRPTGPCLPAHRTVALFRLKPGHLLWPGRQLCGRTSVADIGLNAAHVPQSGPGLFVNHPHLWRTAAPRPPPDWHKYQRGHCLVVSGGPFQTGASRLAAIAALRAGAGAVTLAGDPAALQIQAAHVTAIMLSPAPDAASLAGWIAERRPAAAVIGPGGGLDGLARARLEAAIAAKLPLVIDADGLTLLADRLDLVKGRAAATVLTPHAGEFARLFSELAANGDSKVELARAAARRSGCVVAFKGIDTVIAAPDGRAAINANGGPELATAGSGDVLAGLIGSHLAQGMPAFEAAAAAVWLHAETGRALGPGLIADELAGAVRPLATRL